MNTITEKLKKLIVNDLDINADINNISDDMSLLEDGIGLDSMAVMEFISLVEENFDFQFSDDELGMEPFNSLNTLSQFIADKTAS